MTEADKYCSYVEISRRYIQHIARLNVESMEAVQIPRTKILKNMPAGLHCVRRSEGD